MLINIKLVGVEKALAMFDARKVARAAAGALNRAVKSGRTEASARIRDVWNINKSVIDRKIIIRRAVRSSDLSGAIIVIGQPISLMHFGPKSVSGGITTYAAKNKKGIMPGLAQRRGGRNTRGVKVAIIRGKQTTLRKAFFSIAKKGGTPLVLIRSSKAKSRSGRKEGLLAIKVITEASIFKQGRVMDKVIVKIKIQWQKEWDNQIKQLSSGQGWTEKE